MAVEVLQKGRMPQMRGGGDSYPGNESPGPIVVNHRGDEVIVFSKQSFLDYRPGLVKLTAGLMSSELGWSAEAALRTMDRGLTVTEEDLQDERLIPSVMVLRRGSKTIGVSAQRLIFLKTKQAGYVPVFQHLLRAIDKDYRGKGRGGYITANTRLLHSDARWYVHRTQSPVAVYANQRSEAFEPGQYYPWDALFGTNLLAQEIMAAYYIHARGPEAGWVDGDTGVSANDFPEPNRSYMPKPDHAPTKAILERMEQEFGMVFPGREKPVQKEEAQPKLLPGRFASHGVARFKAISLKDVAFLDLVA